MAAGTGSKPSTTHRVGRLTALKAADDRRLGPLEDGLTDSGPRTACIVEDESSRCWPLPLLGGNVERVRYGCPP